MATPELTPEQQEAQQREQEKAELAAQLKEVSGIDFSGAYLDLAHALRKLG